MAAEGPDHHHIDDLGSLEEVGNDLIGADTVGHEETIQ